MDHCIDCRTGDLGRREFLKLIGGACAAAALPAILPVGGAFAEHELQAGIVHSPACRMHVTGGGHPERPERYDAIMKVLSGEDIAPLYRLIEPRAATDAELLGCHLQEYIDTVRREIAGGRAMLSTGDTSICRDSLEPALLAAGGTLAAVDAVFAGEARNAFCIVRPPGHHAGSGRGMGFCIFNNVAVAARYARRKHNAERVLIADWDVHHGNGTQDIFYEDASVFFFSTHQSPAYPGTGAAEENGAGKGLGTTLNCPMPSGSGRKEVLGAFIDKLVPAANRFRPDLVLISAGFDSRIGDPLGRFTLTDDDFADLTKIMLSIAREHAEGRVVSVLEGGYDLAGLASACTAHLRALAGTDG